MSLRFNLHCTKLQMNLNLCQGCQLMGNYSISVIEMVKITFIIFINVINNTYPIHTKTWFSILNINTLIKIQHFLSSSIQRAFSLKRIIIMSDKIIVAKKALKMKNTLLIQFRNLSFTSLMAWFKKCKVQILSWNFRLLFSKIVSHIIQFN
jgi:hypothetical protein